MYGLSFLNVLSVVVAMFDWFLRLGLEKEHNAARVSVNVGVGVGVSVGRNGYTNCGVQMRSTRMLWGFRIVCWGI